VTARNQLARMAAPAAFLLAATVAVLLIRWALDSDEPVPSVATVATATRESRPVTTPAKSARAKPPATTPPPAAEFYVIESGDTLESVAEQYGTTVEQLLVLNPDVDPVSLTIGQRIRVQ
jgi:LysM repeat protein